jgi:acyl transferase domain-containing protein
VSAPTYPFSADRCWITESEPQKRLPAAFEDALRLHPFISYNSSTLSEVSVDSWIAASGRQMFDISQHGVRHFPASSMLELAYACGTLAGEGRVGELADVSWLAPMNLLPDSRLIRTHLENTEGDVWYAINSLNESGETVVNSRGRIVYATSTVRSETNPLSLKMLKAKCARLDSASHYQRLEELGLAYEHSFRTVHELYICEAYSLSKLMLADALDKYAEKYVLHPAVIDGAFQTAIAQLGAGSSGVSYAPYSLEALKIIHRVSSGCYAYARPVDSLPSGEQVRTFDISLCNDQGETLAEFKGLALRAVHCFESEVLPPAEKLMYEIK